MLRCLTLQPLNSPEMHCWLMFYGILWEEMVRNHWLLFPPLESVPYLLENSDDFPLHFDRYRFLKHLMSGCGLILYHQSFINSRWSNVNVTLYVRWHVDISYKLLRDFKIPEPIINTFGCRWILKILHSVNASQFEHFLSTKSRETREFSEFHEHILWFLLGHLYSTQNVHLLKEILIALQSHNAMHLLDHNQYLIASSNASLNHSRYVHFMGVLYDVVLGAAIEDKGERRNVQCHWIAHSTFLWIMEQKADSMHLLGSICDIRLLTKIFYMHDMFDLVVDQQDYLESVYDLIYAKQLGKCNDTALSQNKCPL